MADTHRLDELRHPEVEAYLNSAETPTALIPVGTTEQHGDHRVVLGLFGTWVLVSTLILVR